MSNRDHDGWAMALDGLEKTLRAMDDAAIPEARRIVDNEIKRRLAEAGEEATKAVSRESALAKLLGTKVSVRPRAERSDKGKKRPSKSAKDEDIERQNAGLT